MQDLVAQQAQLQGLTAKYANARNLQKTALVLAMAMVVSPSYAGKVVQESGAGNTASGRHSAVVGGAGNTASAYVSGVLAGRSNKAEGKRSVVLGGGGFNLGSLAKGDNSLVGGGQVNKAHGESSVILGGKKNTTGAKDTNKGQNAGVFAGLLNTASGTNAGVVAGSDNTASSAASSVLAGAHNTASGSFAAVVAGGYNRAEGNNSVVLGGGSYTDSALGNLAGGNNTVVGGGQANKVYANNSIVFGSNNFVGTKVAPKDNVYILGHNNKIGSNSFVLGSNVNNADVDNAVVFGDKSTAVDGAISVGSTGGERQIKFVKAGTDNSDAVNLEQLNTTADSKANKDASNLSASDVTAWKAKIGNTPVDLSDYYKKTETYSQSEVNAKLGAKVDNADFATYKTDVTAKLGAKVDNTAFNTYKGSVSTALDSKANLNADNINGANIGNWQTKLDIVKNADFTAYQTQVTADLGNKADKTALTPLAKKDASNLTTADVNAWKAKIGSGGTVDLSDYYKKTETYSQSEVNAKLGAKVDNADFATYKTDVTAKLGAKVDNTAFTTYQTQASNNLQSVAKATSGDIDVNAWKAKLGVGAGGVDLTPYAKTADVNSQLATKVNNADFTAYQTQVTTDLGTKASQSALTAVANATSANIDVNAWKAKLGVGAGGGSTPVDLTPYAKTADVNTKLATKVNNTDFTNYQTQVTNDLNQKVNNSDFTNYQTQVTADLGKKVNNSDFTNYQTQVTTALDSKADKTALATLSKTDASNLSVADANTWKAKLGVGAGGVDLTKYAKKTEVEEKISGDITPTEERAVKGKVIDAHLRANYARKADIRNYDDHINDNRQAIVNTNIRLNDLEDETKSGLATVSAMSVLNFDSAPVGALGVGAAIGGYGNKQSVAVGMVYGVNENLKLNGKLGFSTDKAKDTAWGISGTYYFK